MILLSSLLLFRQRRGELRGVGHRGDAPDGELGVELRLGGLDGLGVDAAHLVEHDESLAIEIDADAIPVRAGASLEQAIGDGEDFELLFTCEGAPPSALAGTPVHAIGRVVDRAGGPRVRLRRGEQIVDIAERGFEHRSGAER